MNIQLLLRSFRNYCKKKNIIIQEKINYNDFINNSSSIIFRNITSKHILFSEGYSVVNNPYFKGLNLKPTKGEILTIYCKDLQLNKIIHSGLMIIPLGNDHYAIGATYDWDNINSNPTLQAKKKIQDILDGILNLKYKIIDHVAGIRPSTIDRRPLVGSHKKYNYIHILNGLGSRGVLLGPYLSKCLFEYIYSGASIPNEANINRLYN